MCLFETFLIDLIISYVICRLERKFLDEITGNFIDWDFKRENKYLCKLFKALDNSGSFQGTSSSQKLLYVTDEQRHFNFLGETT